MVLESRANKGVFECVQCMSYDNLYLLVISIQWCTVSTNS